MKRINLNTCEGERRKSYFVLQGLNRDASKDQAAWRAAANKTAWSL